MKSLFETKIIADLHLKNRFVRSATWEALADRNGNLTPELIDVYTTLAQGGVGTIITGMTTVHAADRAVPGMPGLFDDNCIDSYKVLINKVHQYNTYIMPQLGLGGYNAYTGKYLPEKDVMTSTKEDIAETIQDFVNAALRAQKSGFDGVQIHAAHGFLLSRFLSPQYNDRSDDYGGTVENRGRILFEIYEKIRDTLGQNFCITVKINCDDFMPGGLTTKDSLILCKRLAAMGIDAIEVSGNGTSRAGIHTRDQESYFLEFATQLAGSVDTAVILVGGNKSMENMTEILNTTDIDLFALSRPLICEPDLINRWKNKDERASSCISCNTCYSTYGHHCRFNKASRNGEIQ